MEARKLKRVVIKEELFALTEDTFEAIILGQLIYWQERVSDFDKFIEEERIRAEFNHLPFNIEVSNGWIYKKSSDLKEECMLTVSEQTIRKYLQNLEDKGFISSRSNPTYKWDKTLQYRVNIDYVIENIKRIGYDGLSGWNNRISKNNASKVNFGDSIENNGDSYLKNGGAIPEITNIDYKTEKKKEIYKEIVDYWNENIKSYSKVRSVTSKVKSYIDARIKDGNSVDDIKKALLLCESLGDFYKGKEEGKKWKADFFWIIANTNANFDKILTGALHTTNEQQKVYKQVMNGEEYDSNEYCPSTNGSSVHWNEQTQRFFCFNPWDFYQFVDGYTNETRPDGATVFCQAVKYTWSKEKKEWIENR